MICDVKQSFLSLLDFESHVFHKVLLWLRTPIVSSKVMALMLSDARMASLSARVGSSLEGTLAERMTHISHRLTLTARRSARLKGEPSSKRRGKGEKRQKDKVTRIEG